MIARVILQRAFKIVSSKSPKSVLFNAIHKYAVTFAYFIVERLFVTMFLQNIWCSGLIGNSWNHWACLSKNHERL